MSALDCQRCGDSFPTTQALQAHLFAKHGVSCAARAFADTTTCPVCMVRFWSKARITRHWQHDSPACLQALLTHEYEPAGLPGIPDPALAPLPATRVSGPLQPLSLCLPDFVSEIVEDDDLAARWRRAFSTPAMARWLEATDA